MIILSVASKPTFIPIKVNVPLAAAQSPAGIITSFFVALFCKGVTSDHKTDKIRIIVVRNEIKVIDFSAHISRYLYAFKLVSYEISHLYEYNCQ